MSRCRTHLHTLAGALGIALALSSAPLPAQTSPAELPEQMQTSAPDLHPDQQVEWILSGHILPGFDALAGRSADLAEVAQTHCAPTDARLRSAFGSAFDAWVAVSHLRFGPSETANRAFALAFWPDSRNKIPGTLRRALLADGNTTANWANAEAFAKQSIALRGFYALEQLLYDPELMSLATPPQTCALVQAVTADMARTTAAISTDWHASYADELRTPSDRYRTTAEVRQELFKSLTTGLQILGDMRLGRPLGNFDAPRPERAEARRSARSLRHIRLTLAAMEPLAQALAAGDTDLARAVTAAFDKARSRADQLDDPALAGVGDPARRFRLETLQQDVTNIRDLVTSQLGPRLGVTAGFNSLDGD